MLVLSRKLKEEILIGKNIRITVLDIEGGSVKIGIEAPKDISILRMEVVEKIQNENIASASKELDVISAAADLLNQTLSKESKD